MTPDDRDRPNERDIRDALRRAKANPHVKTPPGRIAVNREWLLDELGFAPEASVSIDEVLEELGGDLLEVERRPPSTIKADAAVKPGPIPTLFYVLPERLLES